MERKIDNEFYDDLEEKWYAADDHPIALLRAENQARFPWIRKKMEEHFAHKKCSILDVGCGGGFLANTLAQDGHIVTGIDLAEKTLALARGKDATNSVTYIPADAYEPPFKEKSFDAIFAMDFLEHVDKPQEVIEKVGKLLKDDGLFFFHTFNRNFLSYLFVIKGVEWFVRNTPKNMHVYNLFIKPEELTEMMAQFQLNTMEIVGLSPEMKSRAFWKMLVTRRVPASLKFKIHSSLSMGYLGVAKKVN